MMIDILYTISTEGKNIGIMKFAKFKMHFTLMGIEMNLLIIQKYLSYITRFKVVEVSK